MAEVVTTSLYPLDGSREMSNATIQIESQPYTLQMTILMTVLVIMLIISFISVVAMTFMLLRLLIEPLYNSINNFFNPQNFDEPMPGSYTLKGNRVKKVEDKDLLEKWEKIDPTNAIPAAGQKIGPSNTIPGQNGRFRANTVINVNPSTPVVGY